MEGKVLNLSKSVYELCSEYPELPAILAELGFRDITKPGMLATAGRFMTLPKGAVLKKVDLEHIKSTLRNAGFEVLEV
ncbi:MAG: hypothetical protein K0S04_1704 [Herbinix sp.]|jgi:N-dimethylarginine dimethylaminohydrolase|nr:hypothetical protein [Herbinix sp.]